MRDYKDNIVQKDQGRLSQQVTTRLTPPLPASWTYKDGECRTRFAIPPKETPYYESESGRFWDFPRGAVHPNLLSKLLKEHQQFKQAATMYASASEASDYIASAVVVSCLNNPLGLDNHETLGLLNNEIQKYNLLNNSEGVVASKYTIQSTNEVSRWNKKVVDLGVLQYFLNPGGQPHTDSAEYTIFTTPFYIYEVSYFGATTDSFVKETAQKIFDNLLFE